jgi:hypothetical protein
VAGTVGFSCMGVGTMALVDGYFAEPGCIIRAVLTGLSGGNGAFG